MQPSLYPRSPEMVPSKLTAPNASFKKQAWIAGGVLFLFMVFYLGLTGWFFYKSITLLINILRGGTDAFLSIILFLLFGFMGVFMIKGLFFKIKRDESRSVEITETNEPELFAFIHKVADEVGAPKPHRVFISETVNACVFYDISIVNLLFPRRKNLEIGLGLVNVLDLAEFKSILAHEFGHFAQRSMIIGRWVYVAQQVVYQIVSKRDSFDSFLRGISSIDIRIAWIGWGLSILVWCLRSLAETFFKLVVYTQRALSRQMEFNADLVAVSVTGSDSLVHSLYKLGAADDAYEDAREFANKQLRTNLALTDIFSIQTRSIKNTALILGNVNHGVSPDLEGKDGSKVVVFDEKLAQIPKMWRTHPSNTDRERNAKRTYIKSIPDERSVWLLFSNPQEIKNKVTKTLYQDIKTETQLLPDAEAVKIFDEEFNRKYFQPKYRGVYLNRFITISYENASDVTYPQPESTFAQDSFSKLYPESIQHELEHLKNLEEQLFMLEGVQNKVLDAGGNRLRVNGEEVRRKDLPYVIEQIKSEIEEVRKTVEEHDSKCRNLHYLEAIKLGQGWDIYLLSLIKLIHFCEHTYKHIEDLNRIFYDHLDVTVRTRSFGSGYLNPLINAGNNLHQELEVLFRNAPGIVLSEKVRAHLGANNLGNLLGSFEMRRFGTENINECIKELPHWIQVTLEALTEFRNAGLEELLHVEEYVEERSANKNIQSESAPGPIFVPDNYKKYNEDDLVSVDKKPDILSRIYHADGIAPTIARLLVTGLIISFGILFSMNIGGSRIYIYNGLPQNVVVKIDDREIQVDGESTTQIKLDHKDKVHIKTTTESGVIIEEFDGNMSSVSSKFIYNVAGAGVIYKWVAIYGGSFANDEPEVLGNMRWFKTNGDYIFEEPPSTMSLKAGQTSRKDVIAFYPGAPLELVNLLTDPNQITQLITAHAMYDDANSPNLLLWLDLAYSLPNFKDILDRRVELDPTDVLSMRLQQDVYQGDEKEKLCDKQTRLYENDKNNPDLFYLKWRCMDDSPAQDSAFFEGFKKWPKNAWIANAVAYRYTQIENWEEALKCYQIANENGPELGAIISVEIRRIRQYLDQNTPLTEENSNVPQIAYLNAVENSTENSTTDKFYAFKLLSEGKFNEAVLYSVSDTDVYPVIVRLAAVSEGASKETRKTALDFPLNYGLDNGTIIPAIALRQQSGLSIDVYKDQITNLTGENSEKFFEFIKAVNSKNLKEADNILLKFGTELKAKSCLLGVLLLGDKAPLKWKIYSSRLLFITEKPYFRKQVWME